MYIVCCPWQIVELDDDDDEDDDNREVRVTKSKSTALKLNNNMLFGWEGLLETLELLFVNPILNLQWLDLSFNDLKSVDSVSLLFIIAKYVYWLFKEMQTMPISLMICLIAKKFKANR